MPNSAADNTTPPETGWTKINTAMIRNMVTIGRGEFNVYCVLAACADECGECFPSVRYIAKTVGISERSVRRAISRLIDLGYVTKESRTGDLGEVRSNSYRLPLLTPQDPGDMRDGGTLTSGTVGGGHERRGAPDMRAPLLRPTLLRPTVTKKKARSKAAEVSTPAGLLELIDGWSTLGDQIVKKGNGARRDPPSQAALKGWNRATKNSEQREGFADIPRVLTAIRSATFCHRQGWFTVPWLFGTNKHNEFHITKLLAGGHDEGNGNGKKRTTTDGGQGRSGGTVGAGSPARIRETRPMPDRHFRG